MGSTPSPDVRPEVPPGGDGAHAAHVPTAQDFRETQAGPEFQELRRTHRGFVFPMTIVFLVWYFVFVMLAAYSRSSCPSSCGATSTSAWCWPVAVRVHLRHHRRYVHFANRKLDPKATAIRRIEGHEEKGRGESGDSP